MLKKIIHKINWAAAWLFPEKCFGCRKYQELLCRKCIAALPESSVSRLKFVSMLFSASQYGNPVLRTAIKTLKYRYGRKIAYILGDFVADGLKTKKNIILKEQPIVIPIPMSKNRLRKRGFNHAEDIAKTVAEKCALKFGPDLLCKVKNTYPQAERQSHRERLENIRDSFALNPNFDARGKNILLIDDVATSGATLDEAARVLKNAGADKIYAAVVAQG